MELVKPRIDVGLGTNNLEPMLAFWQQEIGLPVDHVLKVRRGQNQHRLDMLGSVLKINHFAAALPDNPPTGYREVLLARPGLKEPQALQDPDGNHVTLVPPGHAGVTQVGIRVAVRDIDRHRHFLAVALRLPETRTGVFQAGDSLILLERDAAAPSDARIEGKGWRYITFQVRRVDEEHAIVLGRGGSEGMAPVTLGTTARISMVRDPDGNFIELSQRASLTGSLT